MHIIALSDDEDDNQLTEKKGRCLISNWKDITKKKLTFTF